nr:hypothetical protein [uncultured Rhodopila sp.]
MLADVIIEAAGGAEDKASFGAITALGAAIRRAGRFDLAPGVVASARTVKNSPVRSQLLALPLCRLPFAATWFEWPATDELYRSDEGSSPERPTPVRVGALVETDETRQRGTMTLAWAHRHQGVGMCLLSITFDWSAEPGEISDLERDFLGAQGRRIEDRCNDGDRRHPAFRTARDEDIIAHRMRTGVIWCPFMEDLGRAFETALGARPGPGTPPWEAAVADITGEPGTVRAVIMLLNSRNATISEYVPAPERLNVQRVKRRKAPLLDRTTVRIRLSRSEVARAASPGKREANRQHLVRGHFKLRRSGIYWWSDHERGDPALGVLAGQDYRIDP